MGSRTGKSWGDGARLGPAVYGEDGGVEPRPDHASDDPAAQPVSTTGNRPDPQPSSEKRQSLSHTPALKTAAPGIYHVLNNLPPITAVPRRPETSSRTDPRATVKSGKRKTGALNPSSLPSHPTPARSTKPSSRLAAPPELALPIFVTNSK